MMFNVPLPGATGHAVGGVLIALLLGPGRLSRFLLLWPCRRCFLAMAASCPLVPTALTWPLCCRLWPHRVSRAQQPSARQELGHLGFCHRERLGRPVPGGPVRPSSLVFSLPFTNASGAPLCPFPLSIAIPAMMIPHMLVAGVVEGCGDCRDLRIH